MPQAVHIVPTSIVANAVTTVSDANSFLTAIANGGDIKLSSNITLNQQVTISKACNIDFDGKTITFGGDRKTKYNLTVAAPTTLKNGTLTSSSTDDPRHSVLVVNSDVTVDHMTISQPGNAGGHWMVDITNSNVTFKMTDSTIAYLGSGSGVRSTSGIHIDDTKTGVTLEFYGDNSINSSRISWITNCNVYLYSGTLEICNAELYDYTNKSKIHFSGGSIKNTGGKAPFDSLNADQVVVDDGYSIFSDEACTVPLSAADAVSAAAIYTKRTAKSADVDFSGLGDATITLTGRDNENIPLSDGKGTIIEGGKVTSSVPLVFTGAEVTESVDNNTYTYTIDSIPGNTVTVKEAYIQEGTLYSGRHILGLESRRHTGDFWHNG